MAADTTIEFTDENFDAEVLQADVPVIVDFWAEWCMPCRMLASTIDELGQDYDGRAKVGKFDTDANREAAVKFGVTNLPTVIIFKDGDVKKKIVGLAKKEEFVQAIDELI